MKFALSTFYTSQVICSPEIYLYVISPCKVATLVKDISTVRCPQLGGKPYSKCCQKHQTVERQRTSDQLRAFVCYITSGHDAGETSRSGTGHRVSADCFCTIVLQNLCLHDIAQNTALPGQPPARRTTWFPRWTTFRRTFAHRKVVPR